TRGLVSRGRPDHPSRAVRREPEFPDHRAYVVDPPVSHRAAGLRLCDNRGYPGGHRPAEHRLLHVGYPDGIEGLDVEVLPRPEDRPGWLAGGGRRPRVEEAGARGLAS